MTSTSTTPSISLILPLHESWEKCRPVLQALRALQPPPAEVILVSDGPVKGICDLQLSVPLTILRTGTIYRRGAGAARNLGAAAASGDVLLFVDSDVLVPSHLIEQISRALQEHPGAAAIFGSYDAEPAASNFFSQYKNLLHHFVHQHAPGEVGTFWTGCGAIRTPVFRALRGFDEKRGQLEDVELGFRLREHGHSIRLCPEIQVKHLKRYSARSLLRSDILGRALPWSRLILAAHSWPSEQNLQKGQATSALLLAAFLLSLGGSLLYPLLLGVALPSLLALLWCNRAFYQFLQRHRGTGFLCAAMFWHWLYFGYAAGGFLWEWTRYVAAMLTRPGKTQIPVKTPVPALARPIG